VAHVDFLSMSSKGEWKHLLVIVDGFSNFIYLHPTRSTTALEAAEGLLASASLYTLPDWFVTDRGAAFVADVMHRLKQRLGFDHHLVSAYAHSANGKMERWNRAILECFKAIMAETRCNEEDWQNLIPLVGNALNNAKTERLAGLSGREVFMGLQGGNPIKAIIADGTVDLVKVEKIPNWTKMIEDAVGARADKVQGNNVAVAETALRKREGSKKYLISKGAKLPSLKVGDFVLVACPRQRSKLKFQWLGPQVVVDVLTTHVFLVKDLVSNKEANVHVSRIIPFEEGKLLSEEGIKQQAAYINKGYEIQKIVRAREQNGSIQLEIEWFGFTPEFNSWEPAKTIWEDAPEMFTAFVTKSDQVALMKKLCKHVGLEYPT
jgi:hypothetical protein